MTDNDIRDSVVCLHLFIHNNNKKTARLASLANADGSDDDDDGNQKASSHIN